MIKKSPITTQKIPAHDRIVSTAHDLFYFEGIRATGIDRIIKEAGVTKTTFYRHFPSKNDLIIEFLEFRHRRWMTWFTKSMIKYGNRPESLIDTLSEWFQDDLFRGCAFINSVVELGQILPEVIDISKYHKQEMTNFLQQLLPPSEHRKQDAIALSLAIDGAIIHAQIEQSPTNALIGLRCILNTFSS